jgi:hypothetical protein
MAMNWRTDFHERSLISKCAEIGHGITGLNIEVASAAIIVVRIVGIEHFQRIHALGSAQIDHDNRANHCARDPRRRTGCERRISVVKRRHGLNRCRYRGAEGMKRWGGRSACR